MLIEKNAHLKFLRFKQTSNTDSGFLCLKRVSHLFEYAACSFLSHLSLRLFLHLKHSPLSIPVLRSILNAQSTNYRSFFTHKYFHNQLDICASRMSRCSKKNGNHRDQTRYSIPIHMNKDACNLMKDREYLTIFTSGLY